MDSKLDVIVSALEGKQMDIPTRNICGVIHGFVNAAIKVATRDEPLDDAMARDLRHAVAGGSIMAAIGRDEDTMSPMDVISELVESLTQNDSTTRNASLDKICDRALANIQAGKHVMDWDGPLGSIPLPFSVEGL